MFLSKSILLLFVQMTLLTFVMARTVFVHGLVVGTTVLSKNFRQQLHLSVHRNRPTFASRRSFMHSVIAVLPLSYPPQPILAFPRIDNTNNTNTNNNNNNNNNNIDFDKNIAEVITIPLLWVPSLSAYVLKFQLGGEKFGAILDTGSPFLTVPGYCDETKYGCYRPESSQPSGLPPTYERFDNNEGRVEWRRAPFAFLNATGSMMGPKEMTFGVLSDALISGPGGIFFGLVRDTDAWIRPSFLGQTNVKAFAIDLASTPKTLTLTTTSFLKDGRDYIPLVNDLNRKYGDPAVHYTARATSITANGHRIATDGKPIYVVFDTGVTGMVVSQELLKERYETARKNREKSLWGSVDISFRTHGGKLVSIGAHKPVTTPFGEVPWPKFNAHLIVIGLAFLDGTKMIVDIDEHKLWIE